MTAPALLPRPGEPLRTERLELCSLTQADLPALWDLHTDPATWEWDLAPMPQTEATMAGVLATWIADRERHGLGYAAIRARGQPQLLGVGGLTRLKLDGRELLSVYYRFFPRAQGQGYATEALRALVGQADAYLPGETIAAITHEHNAPSLALAARLGLRPEGRRHPDHPELVIWSRLAGEDTSW